MDKAITTALLIVISMLMALTLFNVAYPAIVEGSDAIAGMTARAEEQMRTQISIIHGAGELDVDGTWRDSNSNGDAEVFLWVKNVGDSRITGIEHMDVFFGPEGAFMRIPVRMLETDLRPNWTWHIENADDWVPTATLRIVIHYGAVPPQSGRYFVRVTLPNGITTNTVIGL